MASALAASAVPSLVLARGHRIEQVAEIPLVVDDGAQTLTKTRKALDLLQRLGAAPGKCWQICGAYSLDLSRLLRGVGRPHATSALSLIHWELPGL